MLRFWLSALSLPHPAKEENHQARITNGPTFLRSGCIDISRRNEKGLRCGRASRAGLFVEKDGAEGMVMVKYLAMIAAWVGVEKSRVRSSSPSSYRGQAVSPMEN